MRFTSLFTVTCGALVCACGGGPSQSSATAQAVTPTPAPTPIAAPCAPTDTPIGSAPPAAAAAWQQREYPPEYVPACGEVNGTLPQPKFTNLTAGAVSSTRANELESEFLRTFEWQTWAQKVGDANTFHYLGGGGTFTGDSQVAAQGYKITRTSGPALGCDYPSAVWLVPVTAAQASAFSSGAVTTAGTAFVYEFVGDCTWTRTHPDGTTDPITVTSATPSASGIVVFKEVTDSQMGALTYWDSNAQITTGSAAQSFIQGLGIPIPPSS